MVQLKTIKIKKPAGVNLILGQAHFIKTVEDLHEALVSAIPGINFGLAFCEASGPSLVRTSGTDPVLVKMAAENALKLSCGHCFLIFLKDAYPINVLERIKRVDEVVTIFCATANEAEIVVAETKTGRGVLGVIDGAKSRGIESDNEKKERKLLLREIGYKL
ncbi:MAG: adenosine-specific kinase [Candidatus Pacebacteria bacterium]|nr:adenosine-specific kinase [Candidatus Paceibacterota bacterium]